MGAFSTAMGVLVPRAIAALAGREPTTQVVLREGMSPSLIGRAADGRLDLAVVTPDAELPDGVAVTLLLEDPLLFAVSHDHPLAGRASVPADDLRGERWVAGSKDARSTLLGAWTGSAWRPDVAYVARDWTAKLGLAAAGLAITVVPGLAVPMLQPTLAIVRIEHAAATRPTAIVTRADPPPDPHRDAFAEALRDASAELAADVRRRLRAGAL